MMWAVDLCVVGRRVGFVRNSTPESEISRSDRKEREDAKHNRTL
jgi:hypothetical protein